MRFLRSPSTLALLGLALWAAVSAVLLSEYLYRGVTVTWDESSYLFQAHHFASGKIKDPYPEILVEELSRGMIIMHPDAGWLSRYPFAHALWLSVGVWFGSPRLMIYVSAFLNIIALGWLGRVLGLRLLLLPIVACLMPMFLAMHGTLLSHSSGLTCATLMLATYIRWQSTGQWGYAIVSGLCWALYFNNRTYSAALIAIPFGIDALARFRPHQWRRYGVQLLLFAGAAVSGVLMSMLYNALAVGDAHTSTYLFYNTTQNIGFGPRDGRIVHTLALGLQNTEANLRALDNWLFGFSKSSVLVAVLCVCGLSRRWTFLLVASGVALVGGYVAFWYPGVHAVGPIYYFELLPFLLAMAGMGLQRCLDRAPKRAQLWGASCAVLVLMLTCINWLHGQRQLQASAQIIKRVVADTIAQAPKSSVVIFSKMGRQLIHECALNPHGLDSDPLILVESRRQQNSQLSVYRNLFADRDIFYIIGGAEDTLVPAPPSVPLNVALGIRHARHRSGVNVVDEQSDTLVRVNQDGDPDDFSYSGQFLRLPAGLYSAEFDMELRHCEASSVVMFDIFASQEGRVLVDRALSGSHAKGPLRLDFELSSITEVEPRVRFGGSGNLRLSNVRVFDRKLDSDSGF
ncbi:MAG: hypothetical protein ACI856_000558 [Kiritimatiellia bacterium]|jgi:hypothetical protein